MRADGNPNVAILNQAWSMLWDPSSEYYIPNLLKNGGTVGGQTISPLTSVSPPDMPPIPLYSSSVWGDVSVGVTDIVVTGIPGATNGGFTPASDASTVSGTVTFTQLSVTCDYQAQAGGLVGCAMTDAEANANNPYPPGPVAAAATPPPSDSPNMVLAAQYRDQLVQNGGAGPQLVATYYDQNDTLDSIVNGSNAFTEAWPNAEPAGQGLNTAYFMEQTSQAAQNPDDSNNTVGDDNYNTHSYYMQNILLGVAQYYSNQQPDHDNNPYNDLANAIVGFKGQTMPQSYQRTVGSVVATVQSTPPQSQPTLLAAARVEEIPVASRAREMAERDFPMWQARAEKKAAEKRVGITTYSSEGTISGTLTAPTLTFTGTVQVSGLAPDQTLSITITDLTVAVGSTYSFIATSSEDSGFASDVQNQLNDAAWFKSNIVTQINNQIEKSDLESTISSVLNSALGSLA